MSTLSPLPDAATTGDLVAVAVDCAGRWLHVPAPGSAPELGPSLPTTTTRPGETAFEAAVRCCAEEFGIDVLPTHSDGLTPTADGAGVHTIVAHPATPEALATATGLGEEHAVWLPNRRVAPPVRSDVAPPVGA